MNETLINMQPMCHNAWLSLLVLQNYEHCGAENFNRQKNDPSRGMHKKKNVQNTSETRCSSLLHSAKFAGGMGEFTEWEEIGCCSKRDEIFASYMYACNVHMYIDIVYVYI